MPPSPTDTSIHVTLKEFVESLLEAQDKVTDAKFKASKEALDLQAKEYERRLEDLNHEHQRNIERNADYIGKEKFEAFEKEFRQYKESNDKALVGKERFEAFIREFQQYKTTNDKAVEEKAKYIADAVDQKATSALTTVNVKADAVKKEFDEYKVTQATAAALAAGAKQGMGKISGVAIAAVGVIASLLWATSLVVNIYMATHTTLPQSNDNSELARLRQQQTQILEKFIPHTATPSPESSKN